MSSGDLKTLANFALELAAASRSRISDEDLAVRPEARSKPDRSFVTETDAAVEHQLRALIAARFPGHGILGEEAAGTWVDAEYVWVLDPIDGTAAFIAGIPVYSTLIALCRDARPVVGVMDFPALGLRWVGVSGETTRLEGAPVNTRPCADMTSAILSTSNPDFFSSAQRPAFESLRARTAWRIYGTAALAYGRLAQGRIDLAIDAGLKIWDIAALVPVIEGAGGRVTDWDGKPITLQSGPCILAAGDATLHTRALEFIAGADAAGATRTGREE